jgi:CHASE2 domain-containing sensor protein
MNPMVSTTKLAAAMVVLAFCSFFLVLLALHIKSKFLFITGVIGAVGGILIGVITIFVGIVIFLRSSPKKS